MKITSSINIMIKIVSLMTSIIKIMSLLSTIILTKQQKMIQQNKTITINITIQQILIIKSTT